MLDLHRFCAVIWDFDGTIADSMQVWLNCTDEYLLRQGIKPVVDIKKIAKPKGLMDNIRCMRQYYMLEQSDEEIYADICAHVGEIYKTELQPKSGAVEAVKYLHSKGLRMCIATASTAEYVLAAVKRWGISDCFSFITTCEEVGASKSKPLIFMQAAERLQALPQQTLVFEDGVVGAATAVQAGFFVIGIGEPALADRADELKDICQCYLQDLDSDFKEKICYLS